MLSGSLLQPWLGTTGLYHPSPWAKPAMVSVTGPLVLGVRLGRGGEEVWKAQRRSSQSSWSSRPCPDGTIKEQYPAGTREVCSGNPEPLVSDRGLGWAEKAARLVGRWKALLPAWPGHPPAVVMMITRALEDGAGRWQPVHWFPACLLALQRLPFLSSCPPECSKRVPVTPAPKVLAFQ